MEKFMITIDNYAEKAKEKLGWKTLFSVLLVWFALEEGAQYFFGVYSFEIKHFTAEHPISYTFIFFLGWISKFFQNIIFLLLLPSFYKYLIFNNSLYYPIRKFFNIIIFYFIFFVFMLGVFSSLRKLVVFFI